MNFTSGRTRSGSLPLALAGPALAGACLGLPYGPGPMLLRSASMVGTVAGLTALMLPALYIGAALTGIAPPAREVLGAAHRALRDAGITLLGLAPALGFLVITSTDQMTVLVLGHVVAVLAAVLALRCLYQGLFGSRSDNVVLLLFGAWSVVTLGIGWRLFLATLQL